MLFRSNVLPCTVRKFVFSDINFQLLSQLVCGQNEAFNEIWWHYTSDSSNINDSYVVYNYLENVWYYGTMYRTAWLDTPVAPYPLATFSVQNTYLSGALSSSSAPNQSIPVLNASTYPYSGTVIVGSEQISYTSITSNTLQGCTRGVNGTTVASHVASARVTYMVPNQVKIGRAHV